MRPTIGQHVRFPRERSDHDPSGATTMLEDDSWNWRGRMSRTISKPIGWTVDTENGTQWIRGVTEIWDKWKSTTIIDEIAEDLRELLHLRTCRTRGPRHRATSELERRLRNEADDIRTTTTRRMDV